MRLFGLETPGTPPSYGESLMRFGRCGRTSAPAATSPTPITLATVNASATNSQLPSIVAPSLVRGSGFKVRGSGLATDRDFTRTLVPGTPAARAVAHHV